MTTAARMNLVGRKHEALHRPADAVEDWDRARALAERMRATLSCRDGAALAAAQVGVPLNLVVLERRLGSHAYANVRIVDHGGEMIEDREACLTVPGRWYRVPRYSEATVVAFDLDQEDEITMAVTDRWVARLWQHEHDHLLGLLLPGRFEEIRA